MKTLRILATLLLIFASTKVHAEQFLFKHFDTNDGLPSNSITCIAQDQFGFIWAGTKDGICWFNGRAFQTLDLGDRSIQGSITSICPDKSNCLWISTSTGLFCYNLNIGELSYIALQAEGRATHLACDAEGNIWALIRGDVIKISRQNREQIFFAKDNYINATRSCVDAEGYIWFTTVDGYICQFLPQSNSFEKTRVLSDQQLHNVLTLRHLTAIEDGCFIASTSENDVLRIDPNTKRVETIFFAKKGWEASSVLCLLSNDVGEYLVGTDKGLFFVDYRNGTIDKMADDTHDSFSLSNENIRCLYKEQNNRIWVGTFYSGLNASIPSTITYYRNFSTTSTRSIKGNTVRTICQDNDNNIWLGTEDGYIDKIDKAQNVTSYGENNGLPSIANYHSIIFNKGRLIIASYDDGLFFFDPKEEKVVKHFELEKAKCVYLFATKNGKILVGTSLGLYSLNADQTILEKIPSLNSYFIHSLFQDKNGNLWVGTYGNGVWIMDVRTGQCERLHSEGAFANFDKSRITYIFEDNRDRIWMASEGDGLLCARKKDTSPNTYVITKYSKETGLPSNITCAISQSSKGTLWVSTDKGFCSINPESGSVISTFYDDNNIIGNYFRYGAVMKTQEGVLHLGTTKGLLSFNPESLPTHNTQKIYIVSISSGKADGKNMITEKGKSALLSEHIEIKHKDAAFISLQFASTNHEELIPNKYRYFLSRRNGRNIIESTTLDNTATFAGLNPGWYRFEVMLDGTTDLNSKRRIDITIEPPVLLAKPAIILYFLLFCTFIYMIIRRNRIKRLLERATLLQDLEDKKQREIYDAKIDFFTNITHEVRTPLSLIMMPIDKIIENKFYTKESKQDIMTIKSNADRLLSLTNQLLNLRRMEKDHPQITLIPEDICKLLKQTASYFKQVAKDNHISYKITTPQKAVIVSCAADSVEKILANLISNGVKYCQRSVLIELTTSADNSNAIIAVKSDGERILAANRTKIFDPFFQERGSTIRMKGNTGTGLGLPYAQMLSELNKGKLYLDVEDKEFNTFVLELPIHQEAIKHSSSEEEESFLAIEDPNAFNNRHSMLIVEDDREFNNYIKDELSKEYVVFQAYNGEEAISIIESKKVDLVISDIMMPVVDGYELCNFIKRNDNYSHIPVLLLTSAAMMEKHIESLEAGADGYLEKPFSLNLLKANIENLFKNKEITFQQFTSAPLSHYKGIKSESVDNDFMNKLHSFIMKNLPDQELNVDKIATALSTSKSTLFRKVKANTGMNINEYIKVCRLKKAADLLAEQNYRINEVVDMVGFSSQSYFTANFKKQFNISPSQFIKQTKGQESSSEEEDA